MGGLNFVFYGINFVFCLVGGTMLGVGIWMSVDPDAEEAFQMAGLNEDLYWTSVYFMITVGCLVLIVSVIGLLGAYNSKKFKGALFAFIGIVCLILILELILLIITGVFWDSIDTGTQDEMRTEVQTLYVDEYSTDPISVKWNNMQIDWKCCGSRDYNDYDDSNYKRNTSQEVPWTCCVMHEDGRTLDDVVSLDACRYEATAEFDGIARSEYLHTKGCYSGLKDFLENNSILMIVLTCVFIAIEIGGLVIAFLLLRHD
jgi:hypothetical protein